LFPNQGRENVELERWRERCGESEAREKVMKVQISKLKNENAMLQESLRQAKLSYESSLNDVKLTQLPPPSLRRSSKCLNDLCFFVSQLICTLFPCFMLLLLLF